MNSFVRRFFQVVPAKKAENEAELCEAIFVSIASRFADYFVEHARNVGRVLEAQVFAERHHRAFRDGLREFRMPNEKLFQFYISVIQQQRDGSNCQVQCLLS